MKKTSRRTFGKQVTGALAALPVSRIIGAPGAEGAEADQITQDTKGRSWNGQERFRAIAPALGTVMQALMEESAEYAPVVAEAALSAKSRAAVQSAIADAAARSGATVSQVTRWIDSFNSLGKPGLMSDIPLEAEACAANLNGTWELQTRFSDGVETAARSQIYSDMDPKNGRGTHLITMTTEVNLFAGTTGTVFFIGLADVQFTQNGPYEVIGTSVGTTYGNVPGYENGLKTTDQFRLVRKGQTENMVGFPVRTSSNGEDTAARTLVEVSGDPGTLKFKLWGSAANGGHGRTVDTVDTYRIMSSRTPLVGGWEPIRDYFERVKGSFASMSNKVPSVAALRKFSQDIPIPHGTR